MKKYEYKCPTEKGYFRVWLTKEHHNEIFPNRKTSWATRYEYYMNENHFTMYRFSSRLAIFINLVVFPFMVVYAGISQWDELITDYKKLLNEKKYGSFSADDCWNREGDKFWPKLKKLIEY